MPTSHHFTARPELSAPRLPAATSTGCDPFPHRGAPAGSFSTQISSILAALRRRAEEAPLPPALPDVEGRVEHVGFLQLVQLYLGVPHLVVHAFQLVVQLQLLPLELAVFLLVPSKETESRWARGSSRKRNGCSRGVLVLLVFFFFFFEKTSVWQSVSRLVWGINSSSLPFLISPVCYPNLPPA